MCEALQPSATSGDACELTAVLLGIKVGVVFETNLDGSPILMYGIHDR